MSFSQSEMKLISIAKLKRIEILTKFQEFHELFINREVQPNNNNILRKRLPHLDELLNHARDAHSKILEATCLKPENEYYKESQTDLTKIETIYFLIKDEYSVEIKPPNLTQNITSSTANLPKILLKQFNGNIQNWPEFYQQYLSVIHNNTQISTITKFQYLIGCLTDSALLQIKDIPILEENYLIAFNKLINKYQDKRGLASNYLNKIINIKPITTDNLQDLQKFTDTLSSNYSALKELKIENLAQVILFQIAYKNLNTSTRKHFEMYRVSKEIPHFDELIKFLENYTKDLSNAMAENKKSITPSSSSIQPSVRSPIKTRSLTASLKKLSPCPVCTKMDHAIYKCPKFLSLSPRDRKEKVKLLKLCLNCFHQSHFISDCQSKYTCQTCKQKHHSLIHIEEPNDDKKLNKTEESPNTSGTNETNICVSNSYDHLSVLLPTAQVHILASNGNFYQFRALIDSGAMTSCITNKCVKTLKLFKKASHLKISGISSKEVKSKGEVELYIKSTFNNEPILKTTALILDNITSNLPSHKIRKLPEEYQHLKIADPEFRNPASIDLLIGADLISEILTGEIKPNKLNYPTAINTIFGWCFIGKVNDLKELEPKVFLSTIESDIQRFWSLEELPEKPILNPIDEKCEKLFQENHYRETSGRYVVPILLKEEPPLNQESISIAQKSLIRINKRLENQLDLKSLYFSFMQEYETLGHMTRIGPFDPNSQAHFLPYHFVLKPESTSTRLRVVFNSSAKTINNKSLNEFLFSGPKLQKNLFDIIVNFRIHPIVFTSDISKMYRQILILPEERKYQHILFEDQNKNLSEYELNTISYGTTSAPYLALRTLQQLAEDEGEQFPIAKNILLNYTFVDDIAVSYPSVDEAIDAQKQIILLLEKGKFQLRKWSSNHPALLKNIDPEDCETSMELDRSSDILNVLGIKWNPSIDTFSFKTIDIEGPITKRSILSNVSRIFDPLGWASPVIILSKCIIRKLWEEKLGWDEKIPNQLEKTWEIITQQVPLLSKLNIPRHATIQNPTQCQLIGFCDASQKAYGAVIYLRSINENNEVKTSLLTSKSKVAPIKLQSIPRLELLACLLLSQMLDHIYNILKNKLNINNCFAYSDSEVALAWMKIESYKLQTFVAHRVEKIQELSKNLIWNYVPSKENPADLISRGCYPKELLSNNDWIQGPIWLQSPIEHWPNSLLPIFKEDSLPELKKSILICDTFQENDLLENILTKYSNYFTLIRVVARIKRALHNFRFKSNRIIGFISKNEFDNALYTIILYVQDKYLKNKNNRIFQRLNTFTDNKGLLRVGGRLKNSNLSEEKKYPILLPKESILSNLIIKFYHEISLHAGPRTTQSLVCRKFWILSARSAIRSILSKCVICIKARPKYLNPFMGDLPASRIQESSPFLKSGCDFGGPFKIKFHSGRSIKYGKAYLCLFVCFTTKAVHLECVSELSTDAFIAALQRFVGRRGLCSDIYTDKGTNFQGARSYYSEIENYLNQEENREKINNYLSHQSINWHFNPPASPHFGGIFEAGIKSAKYHIRRVIGEQILTFEEYSTLFVNIEAIMNSRPLCPLSDDPNEVDVLTPGHFLIGRPLLSLPEEDLSHLKLNRLGRWQLVQQVKQSFWKRWNLEYLNTLQQRNKWLKSEGYQLKINDIVLVKDKQSLPAQWRIGRIVEIHPGEDNIVRVVKIKTARGIIKRSAVDISPLLQD